MKKIITVFVACMTIFAVHAQEEKKDSKQAVLNDITKDACECISAKSGENLSQKDLEVQLGLCMINSYGKYKSRIDKYMNVSLDDPDSLELLGQEIGLNMLTICPDTFMSFAKEFIEEEVDNYNETKGESTNVSSVKGKAVKLTKDQFNILNFKGENKRVYKLLWMEYFEGQELLEDFKKLKNKEIRVSFESKEMYDPALKDYRTYKVLRKIEVVRN